MLLQQDVISELDRLKEKEEEVLALEKQIRHHHKKLDPHEALTSLPGLQHVLASGIRSCIGDIDRFNSVTKHRGYELHSKGRATLNFP